MRIKIEPGTGRNRSRPSGSVALGNDHFIVLSSKKTRRKSKSKSSRARKTTGYHASILSWRNGNGILVSSVAHDRFPVVPRRDLILISTTGEEFILPKDTLKRESTYFCSILDNNPYIRTYALSHRIAGSSLALRTALPLLSSSPPLQGDPPPLPLANPHESLLSARHALSFARHYLSPSSANTKIARGLSTHLTLVAHRLPREAFVLGAAYDLPDICAHAILAGVTSSDLPPSLGGENVPPICMMALVRVEHAHESIEERAWAYLEAMRHSTAGRDAWLTEGM